MLCQAETSSIADTLSRPPLSDTEVSTMTVIDLPVESVTTLRKSWKTQIQRKLLTVLRIPQLKKQILRDGANAGILPNGVERTVQRLTKRYY